MSDREPRPIGGMPSMEDVATQIAQLCWGAVTSDRDSMDLEPFRRAEVRLPRYLENICQLPPDVATRIADEQKKVALERLELTADDATYSPFDTHLRSKPDDPVKKYWVDRLTGNVGS